MSQSIEQRAKKRLEYLASLPRDGASRVAKVSVDKNEPLVRRFISKIKRN